MMKQLFLTISIFQSMSAGRCDPELFLKHANQNYAQFLRFEFHTSPTEIKKITHKETCYNLLKELLELRKRVVTDRHDCTVNKLKKEFDYMRDEYAYFYEIMKDRLKELSTTSTE